MSYERYTFTERSRNEMRSASIVISATLNERSYNSFLFTKPCTSFINVALSAAVTLTIVNDGLPFIISQRHSTWLVVRVLPLSYHHAVYNVSFPLLNRP